MRQVYYCLWLSDDHLKLIVRGWQELHCLLIEGDTWVKMVSP
jgi:hypothetical protein